MPCAPADAGAQPDDEMGSGVRRNTEIALATGTLTLDVDRADWPLDDLCDYATRRNPKRAFLIVSKVLGRHIPVAPSRMRQAVRDLAARIPADLPGPVLVMGLAETAIGLGQAVAEELGKRPGFDGLYLHSTRQELDVPLLCRFEEPHSHASAHLVYRPEGVDLGQVRSLVLVDDEISTGTTLANLASALAEHLPALERVAAAAFVDWSGGAFLSAMPAPASAASLASGRLEWRGNGSEMPADTSAFASAAPRLGRMVRHRNFGRLGIAPGTIPPLPEVDLPAGAPVRIICTGEFTYAPFRLGEALETAGHDVIVQSTTRSPVLPGGAIRHILGFEDNYATGIPNFLYNAGPADRRISLICHETPADSVDHALIAALGATLVDFGA